MFWNSHKQWTESQMTLMTGATRDTIPGITQNCQFSFDWKCEWKKCMKLSLGNGDK